MGVNAKSGVLPVNWSPSIKFTDVCFFFICNTFFQGIFTPYTFTHVPGPSLTFSAKPPV